MFRNYYKFSQINCKIKCNVNNNASSESNQKILDQKLSILMSIDHKTKNISSMLSDLDTVISKYTMPEPS